MEKFCKDLKENAIEIINYEKKEMIPLTDEETEFYEKQKVCHICKKEFNTNKNNLKSQRSLSLHRKIQESCAQQLQFKI